MVNTPEPTTLAVELPVRVPSKLLPTTAILAEPPRKRPIAAMAMSEKKSAPPVRASTWPRMVNGITISTATPRMAPIMLLVSSPR